MQLNLVQHSTLNVLQYKLSQQKRHFPYLALKDKIISTATGTNSLYSTTPF